MHISIVGRQQRVRISIAGDSDGCTFGLASDSGSGSRVSFVRHAGRSGPMDRPSRDGRSLVAGGVASWVRAVLPAGTAEPATQR